MIMVMREGENNEEQNSKDIGNNPTEHIHQTRMYDGSSDDEEDA